MIPFEEIDSRLLELKKDRAWLAQATRRSPETIASALAMNAAKHKRSKALRQLITDVIEREESAQVNPPVIPSLPDRITVEVPSEKFNNYLEAADYARQNLKEWTIKELDRAAEEWLRLKTYKSLSSVAEEPPEATGTDPK